MLAIRDLSVDLGGQPVLAGIDLDLAPGEMLAILGPSGSGKSTLLKVLTGQVAARHGRITLNGQPLNPRGAFAYMPQTDALMDWRRADANAALGLEVAGMPARAARAAARSHFPDFGLAGYERAWPRDLSGGMRQRLALMRTVIQGKPVLLLDEPLGALDALTRQRMQLWLADMRARHGWTVLLITHDVREAVLLADRIAVLTPRPARIRHVAAVPLPPHPRGTTSLTAPEARALEAELLTLLLEKIP